MITFSFLEIEITCYKQQLRTSVYRKPTFSVYLRLMKVIWGNHISH